MTFNRNLSNFLNPKSQLDLFPTYLVYFYFKVNVNENINDEVNSRM